jgi:IstB-like ATP binding protein
MAQAFAELEASDETAALTHADWLGLLVDRELTHRRDKRLAARLRYVRPRQQASIEDVDYRAPARPRPRSGGCHRRSAASTAPADASMSARRSFAANRCRPL